MKLNSGLVFMSDTRTNAGVDNISSFRKMYSFHEPGHSSMVILAAGNLGTTQAVISLLEERTKAPDQRSPILASQPTMFQAARLVGDTLKEVVNSHASEGQRADSTFRATLILGGQVQGSEPRLFMIYPEGNFIEVSEERPFFQIGETKYGKPILVRAYDQNMSFEEATRLLLVSFDSTVKANLSVGLPFHLQTLEKDTLKLSDRIRIEEDNPGYTAVSKGWGDALQSALQDLPEFKFPESEA
jgi:putative proteasome-type protease